MKQLEEDRIRLLDIAGSIREIQSYIGRENYSSFAKRDDIREAVSSQLLQIGGAAALLSDEFKDKYGDIDWNVLIGLQYAHFDEELELDLHPIWNIVHTDLPQLSDQVLDLAVILEQEEDLKEVSLNEEDLRDLNSRRRGTDKLTNMSKEDIHLLDETEGGENKRINRR